MTEKEIRDIKTDSERFIKLIRSQIEEEVRAELDAVYLPLANFVTENGWSHIQVFNNGMLLGSALVNIHSTILDQLVSRKMYQRMNEIVEKGSAK